MTNIERFFSYVKYTDECWPWIGGKYPYGYGQFWYPEIKKCVRAHRWSYEYFHGEQLEKFACCHHCDNPSCVNPDHLFKGTLSENTQDSIAKGRHKQKSQTQCKNGHVYTKESLYRRPKTGWRECKICLKKYYREYRLKKLGRL